MDATICKNHADAAKEHVPSDSKRPGHWLLARIGKRVLRPGGLQLTRQLLAALDVQSTDEVVEFAAGLGVTARLVLERHPAHYTAVERDASAAATVRTYLPARHACILGSAEETGLPSESASIVFGEAMLSMQPAATKAQIVKEAARLLRPNGRYGIHELCLVPDDADAQIRTTIQQELSREIHVGVRPLTRAEWCDLLAAEGLQVDTVATAPMHLLEPRRLVQDEGLFGAMRFVWNVARNPLARQRVVGMRRMFRKYANHLAAIAVVGRKTGN
jgi:SAM-dependent methyltransferase